VFSNTFYPTPKELAEKLILPYRSELWNGYILDPSAGKGDLLDLAKQVMSYHNPGNLYAIEINQELQHILRGKGYPVIGADFLEYAVSGVLFTHIFMNPPFDRAEDHLLHAWKILVNGKIACIYPKSSLDGKTAKEQTLLKLIEDHGSVEDVGRPFSRGERPTDVECVIVRLSKNGDGPNIEWEFSNSQEMPRFAEDNGQELVVGGFINGLLAHYNISLEEFERCNRHLENLSRYCKPFGWREIYKEIESAQNLQERWNRFYRKITEAAWTAILEHPGFQSLLSVRARNMISEFRLKQTRMDFNEENIRAMLEALLEKRQAILDAVIQDAFDELTKFHKENRVYFEGWNSNEAWKVAPKVVLPYYVRRGLRDKPELDYRNRDRLMDIDRALCVVSGKKLEEIATVAETLQLNLPNWTPGASYSSTFFTKIRAYKKGTLHLTFRDPDILAKFNRMAAQGRNWLPPAE